MLDATKINRADEMTFHCMKSVCVNMVDENSELMTSDVEMLYYDRRHVIPELSPYLSTHIDHPSISVL